MNYLALRVQHPRITRDLDPLRLHIHRPSDRTPDRRRAFRRGHCARTGHCLRTGYRLAAPATRLVSSRPFSPAPRTRVPAAPDVSLTLMPILYVHGVNTRSRDGFFALRKYLERHIAPAISSDPKSVLIDDVYWGDLAATFAWDGESRPRSRLLGQGAAESPAALALLASASAPDVSAKL